MKTSKTIQISNQKVHSLFFDGAAKGNPSKARAGGIVKNIEGISTHSFAWGLGVNSKIEARHWPSFKVLSYS